MDVSREDLILLLFAFEVAQLFAFWLFVHQRYHRSLRQLKRLAEQLATGRRPKSYYIGGPPLVGEVIAHLEMVGTRLDDFQRQQLEDDFNLNVLLANMVEGVMVVDQRRVVRLVNNELLNLFALKQSPLGRTVLESLRESRVEMIVRETIQLGERRQQEVMLESTGLGRPSRHFEVSVVPIRTKNDEVGGAVVVFHEITRIKQLEVVRQEFVANVSHELRTPLAIFRGYLETMADNPDLPREDTRRIVATMRRHSNRLNALIEDLLALTRLEIRQIRSEFTTVRADAFFRQLMRDWEKRVNSGDVSIQLEVAENMPPIELDEMRMEQVFFNLMENAIAYSNPPRRLIISALPLPGEKVELRVADNGIGIPPADLPHVFERFYRVDKGRSRASGGTGLGLSIVKHIIQAHHGTVHAESEFGKGTTIVIRLPVHQQADDGSE